MSDLTKQTLEPTIDRPAVAPRRTNWTFLVGLGAILLAAVLLRTINLGSLLPRVVFPDEPPIMEGARAVLRGDFTPSTVGWPPASMEALALSIGIARFVARSSVAETNLYLFGRVFFVLLSLATVAAAGALGARLSDSPNRRRLVALGTAGVMGVSYLSVRLGRQIHPDHLEVLFAVASFICALAFDRSRRWRWLAGAGLLAGLAGATKYVGVLVMIPAAVSVVSVRRTDASRFGALSLLAAFTGLGFLLGNPGPLVDFNRFREGILFQFHRNTTGHLGYESDSPVWGFHLTQSLPGNWGWPITILAVLGTIWVLRRGSRAQRLAASFVVPAFVLLGLFRVTLPHHMLVLTPFLAGMAVVALVRLTEQLIRSRASVVTAVLLALFLLPTLLDDLRLVRAARARDTRVEAGKVVSDLAATVWAENYALPFREPEAVNVGAFGGHPEVLRCSCYAVISSYMEDRFRRRPDLYRNEVSVYDAMRGQGKVVLVVKPFMPLAYDWDVLPQWGLRKLPLWGKFGATGPTLTILDLHSPWPETARG